MKEGTLTSGTSPYPVLPKYPRAFPFCKVRRERYTKILWGNVWKPEKIGIPEGINPKIKFELSTWNTIAQIKSYNTSGCNSKSVGHKNLRTSWGCTVFFWKILIYLQPQSSRKLLVSSLSLDDSSIKLSCFDSFLMGVRFQDNCNYLGDFFSDEGSNDICDVVSRKFIF